MFVLFLEKRQQQQRNKKTVSVSSLDMGERYTFHPSAVMLGDEGRNIFGGSFTAIHPAGHTSQLYPILFTR